MAEFILGILVGWFLVLAWFMIWKYEGRWCDAPPSLSDRVVRGEIGGEEWTLPARKSVLNDGCQPQENES